MSKNKHRCDCTKKKKGQTRKSQMLKEKKENTILQTRTKTMGMNGEVGGADWMVMGWLQLGKLDGRGGQRDFCSSASPRAFSSIIAHLSLYPSRPQGTPGCVILPFWVSYRWEGVIQKGDHDEDGVDAREMDKAVNFARPSRPSRLNGSHFDVGRSVGGWLTAELAKLMIGGIVKMRINDWVTGRP